ncbi:ABC transporter permease [Nakamurella flavida]|uniref:ABC transporter permease n=1 Tax=Nakamurella flavida TaxID=363630 RepID=A0A938YRR8_9ACTN|nr:ABC transporter permease [Nakamurella flavida]MBM9477700.1 ABC transporter permease [Nakamurella flavida]MDP9779252.1 peptide/nickel transport system permease protein/oligopeptide transport system permease protein [Nakamurella flavida]
MTRFVLRRLLELLVVFIGVTFVIYALVFALKGDPIASLAGDRPLPATVVATLRARYHLDDPLISQYWRWLTGVFRGDLGTDFTGRSVSERMASRWPTTIVLALTAWVLEVVIGAGLGLISGLRQGGTIDRAVLLGTIVISSIPIFVVAVTSQLLLGVNWGWVPVAGTQEGWPVAFLLPAACLAVFGLAAVSRLMRGSVIDSVRSDYVRTLWAKGLSERRVVGVHVLRNAGIPVLTFAAIDLGYLLGGAIIVEGIFNMPGIGQLLFSAIRNHEGPVVVGVSTALVIIFLVISALVDIANSLLDPRIRRD